MSDNERLHSKDTSGNKNAGVKIAESSNAETLVCGTCGKEIAHAKARTDITRYLSDLSRCQCINTSVAEDSDNLNSEISAEKDKFISSENKDNSDTTAKVENFAKISEILGSRFEIISFLGQGGMGSVYKVLDRSINKVFAIKILDARMVKDKHSVKRFEQEAKAAMQLTHPHLTAVYEYGLGKNDVPFIVMDYLEGKTLAEILTQEKCLSHKRVVDLFIQICEAVIYAHQFGVIHRDIKPNNIMILKTESGIEYAKLFDFGIAKVMPENAIDYTSDLTQTGELFGSPAYMSPEQLKGQNIDARTDIYAIGCTMYKCLTGTLPFESNNVVETIISIITSDFEKISQSISINSIPLHLQKIVLCCLSKETNKRYPNATALLTDLEAIRDNKSISNLSQNLYKSVKQNQSRKTGAMVLKGFFLLGFLSIATNLLFQIWSMERTTTDKSPAAASFRNKDFQDAWNYDMQAAADFSKGDYDLAIPRMQFGIEAYKKGFKSGAGTERERAYMADLYSHIGKCYLEKGKLAKKSNNNSEAFSFFEKAQENYRNAIPLYNQVANWYSKDYFNECINDYFSVLKYLGHSEQGKELQNEYKKYGKVKQIP